MLIWKGRERNEVISALKSEGSQFEANEVSGMCSEGFSTYLGEGHVDDQTCIPAAAFCVIKQDPVRHVGGETKVLRGGWSAKEQDDGLPSLDRDAHELV